MEVEGPEEFWGFLEVFHKVAEADRTTRAINKVLWERVQELEKLLASAQEDATRLNWIRDNLASIHCNWTSPNDWTVTMYHGDASVAGYVHGDTLRETIDKAVRRGKP